ncbi:protein Wnt-2b-A-like isoform X2 [Stegodyphus dumicola]|uniref:protein Wnt-2b-A-like isoform X2 n=1 Tax=Stegodyphus dumicola TaxID=202533 RepID=UPI0015AED988|nr:protein Wnt-2b-A-like isoform X2 [Stegodyphus dumicola]
MCIFMLHQAMVILHLNTSRHSSLLSAILMVLISCCTQRATGTWWLLSRLPISSVHTSTHMLCSSFTGLVKQQRQFCMKYPEIILIISQGAQTGVRECQSQFEYHRWNCSTITTGATAFRKNMLKESRETAFLYSIISAGVTDALIRACSKSEKSSFCVCDEFKRQRGFDSLGEFKWSGCSNMQSGMRFSKQFIDAEERRIKDARALFNIHNNRVGRKAVMINSDLKCKCHGISGSCGIRTCFSFPRNFKEIGQYLKQKYEGAVQVTINNQRKLAAVEGLKRFTKNDLVYLDPSPDYCVVNKKLGTMGINGRRCIKDSLGPEGCDILCCGRGYDTWQELYVYQCNCMVTKDWCCAVQCDECKKWRDVYTCKMR